jgi:DNA invertase Pin-like site-specific DNA recombinase
LAAEVVTAVRVVGYVRESADPAGASAFSQQEELRRYATEHGHLIVSVCQDLRSPGVKPSRDGYLSVLGVIAAGGVEAVLVPRLSTFASDSIIQEIMMWDLRGRGIRVISTDPVDLRLLDAEQTPGADRIVIREVLERVGEHARDIVSRRPTADDVVPDADVLVQIIAADERE